MRRKFLRNVESYKIQMLKRKVKALKIEVKALRAQLAEHDEPTPLFWYEVKGENGTTFESSSRGWKSLTVATRNGKQAAAKYPNATQLKIAERNGRDAETICEVINLGS